VRGLVDGSEGVDVIWGGGEGRSDSGVRGG